MDDSQNIVYYFFVTLGPLACLKEINSRPLDSFLVEKEKNFFADTVIQLKCIVTYKLLSKRTLLVIGSRTRIEITWNYTVKDN